MQTDRKPSSRTVTTIADIRVEELHAVIEPRGKLIVGECERQIPFVPRRFFVVTDVPAGEVRSNHAHRLQHQFLIALQGVCKFLANDGRLTRILMLDRPTLGLYLPPQIWISYSCSTSAMLLVLASDLYDPQEYFRDYGEFVRTKWDT